MGLDMYLLKTKRIEGFLVEDYFKVEDFVVSNTHSNVDIRRLKENLNLENVLKLKGANKLIPCIKNKGGYFAWYSIFEDVGYWRKANAIHRWFVKNVQNGKDDCNPYNVSKEQIEALLNVVNMVLNKERNPEQILPTQKGFFFGSIDYDEYYFEDLEYTKRILEKVLKEIDFEQDILFYQSSW